MARIEVPVTVLNTTTGLPINGAAVAISVRASGAPATWYSAETGGTSSTGSVITDASGRVTAWVDRGAYNLTVSGTGITTYTEPWDAAPGVNGSVDTLWIADGNVTNAKIASGIDAGKLTIGTLPAAQLPTLPADSVGSSQIAAGAVGVSELSAGSRLLGGFNCNKFVIGNNTDVQIGTGSITHNGKGGFVVLNEYAHHNDGSWSGQPDGSYGMWFRIKRGGVTQFQIDLDLQGGGYTASAHGIYAFGALSGAQTWSVTVGIGNIPVTLQNWGQGSFQVFESY